MRFQVVRRLRRGCEGARKCTHVLFEVHPTTTFMSDLFSFFFLNEVTRAVFTID